MEDRRFGDTDLTASAIGFGTWALGSDWWGEVTEADGERLLSLAIDLGITFFDTGDAYGRGANEELVGRVLAPHRDSVQIATKFGYDLAADRRAHSEGERPQRWDGPFVRAALEASLARLGTDRVDLFQLHNPRMDAIDCDETFAALEDLKAEGKIREYGVALGPAIGWREEGIEAIERRGIAALQTVYNLLEQEPGRAFMAAAEERGVGVMARVPTSSGLLDDTLTPETRFTGSDHRRHRPQSWLVEGLQKIERIRFLCEETGRSMPQAALRYILDSGITTVIPTITSDAELREYAAAAEVEPLSDEELTRVGELYERNFDVEPVSA